MRVCRGTDNVLQAILVENYYPPHLVNNILFNTNSNFSHPGQEQSNINDGQTNEFEEPNSFFSLPFVQELTSKLIHINRDK